MNEPIPASKGENREGYLFTYAQIVFNQSRRLAIVDSTDQDLEGWMLYTHKFQVRAESLEIRILAIVTTALFFEAYIYDYGARKKSAKFVEKYLDKLDPVAKWVVIPRLIRPPGLNQDDEVFGRLRKLFRLRNDLIHHKTKSGGDFYVPPDLPEEFSPTQCVKLIQDVLTKLFELDDTDELSVLILRHINSWIEYCEKDKRFYPVLWEA